MPCHSKGNIGAMPLTNYKEVVTYGKMIGLVTKNKIMPPWKADGAYATLKNHNTLVDEEIELIKKWIDSGMTKGKLLKNNIYKKEIEKHIVKPDLVIAMQQTYTQKDDYTDRTQVFVIPTMLQKDVYIDAIEFVPGNKKIVKTCTVSIDTSTTAEKFDSYDLNYGYNSFAGLSFTPYQYGWYQWTPDSKAIFYDSPYVKKINARSKMLLHITYNASTSIQKDSSLIKFRFLKKGQEKKTITSNILFSEENITNPPFVINVDEKKKYFSSKKIDKPIEIHSIMPQGQYACYNWEIYAIDSISGKRINLLNIPKWDAHWKKKYELKQPVVLSAGSQIFGITFYNNSEENPNLIILPPKKIKNGEDPRDELFLVLYDIVEL